MLNLILIILCTVLVSSWICSILLGCSCGLLWSLTLSWTHILRIVCWKISSFVFNLWALTIYWHTCVVTGYWTIFIFNQCPSFTSIDKAWVEIFLLTPCSKRKFFTFKDFSSITHFISSLKCLSLVSITYLSLNNSHHHS